MRGAVAVAGLGLAPSREGSCTGLSCCELFITDERSRAREREKKLCFVGFTAERVLFSLSHSESSISYDGVRTQKSQPSPAWPPIRGFGLYV